MANEELRASEVEGLKILAKGAVKGARFLIEKTIDATRNHFGSMIGMTALNTESLHDHQPISNRLSPVAAIDQTLDTDEHIILLRGDEADSVDFVKKFIER